MATEELVEKIIVQMEFVDNKTGNVMREKIRETAAFSKKISRNMQQITRTTTDYIKGTKQVTSATKPFFKRFRMDYLGLMFGFMIASRAINTFGKEAIDIFLKVSGAVTEQGRALMTLSAWWTYLKFEIGSAIASALQPLIPILVGIIIWITDLIKEHPKLAGWIFVVTAALLLFGFIIYQVLLFTNALAINMALSTIAMNQAGTAANVATVSFWGVFWSIVRIVLIVAIVIAAFYLLYKVWVDGVGTTKEKVLASLLVIGIGIMLIAALFGLWPLALAMAVVAIIALLVLFWDRFKNFFVLLGLVVKQFVLEWELSFTGGLVNMIYKFVDFINKLISLWNKAFGKVGLGITPLSYDNFITRGLVEHMGKVKDELEAINKKGQELNKWREESEQPADKLKRIFGFGENGAENSPFGTESLGALGGAGTTVGNTNNFDFNGMNINVGESYAATGAMDEKALAEKIGQILGDKVNAKMGSGVGG